MSCNAEWNTRAAAWHRWWGAIPGRQKQASCWAQEMEAHWALPRTLQDLWLGQQEACPSQQPQTQNQQEVVGWRVFWPRFLSRMALGDTSLWGSFFAGPGTISDFHHCLRAHRPEYLQVLSWDFSRDLACHDVSGTSSGVPVLGPHDWVESLQGDVLCKVIETRRSQDWT